MVSLDKGGGGRERFLKKMTTRDSFTREVSVGDNIVFLRSKVAC